MKAQHVQRMTVDLAAKLAAMQRADTYPEPPGRIEGIETHMSWVFLTEHHAYKLKKPVRYDFLDFSTLEARRRSCQAETQLNRQLAAGVYLGVAALTVDAQARMRLDGDGDTIEWLVKMRRLPAERMLDHLLRTGGITAREIARIAEILARFYRDSRSVPMSASDYLTHYAEQVRINHATLTHRSFGLADESAQRVHASLSAYLGDHGEVLGARASMGRIIDGHGDLRAEHVCIEDRPVIFDRLEFNRRFRLVDPIDELGSLAMECDALGAPRIGEVLFSTYAGLTQDTPAPALVHFYKAHRACLRARLAILHTRELAPADWEPWRDRARAYLDLAARYTDALGADTRSIP